MFQQRHFEAIAQMMQETSPDNDANMPFIQKLERKLQWERTVTAMCQLFQRHNSNFMTDRFVQACQPGANVKARKVKISSLEANRRHAMAGHHITTTER